MTYIPCLTKLQLVQEATLGAGGTHDIQPAGLDVTVTPKVEVEQLATKSGTTMPAEYSFVKKRWAEGTFEGYLDYNRAMLWFDGMFGVDATSPHEYTSATDTAPTPKSMGLVYGQTGLIYEVKGIVPRNLKLSANSGEPWKFAYEWFGVDVADGASFQALTTDVPEFAHGYDTELYMDDGLAVAAGTTARADVAFSFEADITANHEPVFHLGDQEFDSTRSGKYGGSMKLVIEADATALVDLGDILDATDTGVGYTIRLRATDGTNTLDLDFAGVCMEAPVLITDTDGVVTIELNLVPQYNSVMGGCWEASLTIA